jgi:hypothetical protein
MEEIWKPVPSKEGVQASSIGRVRLPERTVNMPNGGTRRYFTKPTFGVKTKASKTARHQYFGLMNAILGNMKVHRLVCEAFHGQAPSTRSVVIHINENALDNRAENLRWGTQKENLNMPNFVAYCKSRTCENSTHWKSKKARNTD